MKTKFFFILLLLTIVSCKKPDDQLLSHEVSQIQHDKNLIIESALAFKLPPTNALVVKEVHPIIKNAFDEVKVAHYEQALHIILEGLKDYPHNFPLQTDLAMLLGDCAEITPSPLRERMIEKSKEIFNRLIYELDGQPRMMTYRFLSEYYFRFELYREQYELGLERVAEYWGKTNERCIYGYYGQGVGAAHYAHQLLMQGNCALAQEYAQKALVAWAQYFSYEHTYYNSYVHYALALGILGYKEEMMRALERSASLIKRDLDYPEFKEVIDIIEGIE